MKTPITIREIHIWIKCPEIRGLVAAGVALRWLRLLLLVPAIPLAIVLRLLMMSLESLTAMVDKIGAILFAPIDLLRSKRHSLIKRCHEILPVSEIQARTGRGD